MAKLVIDASLAAAWCFPDEHTDFTNAVLRIVGTTLDPIAPALWAYEIRKTILMGLKRGRITKEGVQKLLLFLNELNVQLVNPVSYDALFHLAEVPRLTLYDAAYLDLSLREGVPIASLDDALCKAARSAGVPIFKIPQST
jgi:predicted nucleic acid-binding protein